MLATNYHGEDHIHRCIRAVDPDNPPPSPDLGIREFIEECRCGAIRLVRSDGVPTCEWQLEGWPGEPEDDEPEAVRHHPQREEGHCPFGQWPSGSPMAAFPTRQIPSTVPCRIH